MHFLRLVLTDLLRYADRLTFTTNTAATVGQQTKQTNIVMQCQNQKQKKTLVQKYYSISITGTSKEQTPSTHTIKHYHYRYHTSLTLFSLLKQLFIGTADFLRLAQSVTLTCSLIMITFDFSFFLFL